MNAHAHVPSTRWLLLLGIAVSSTAIPQSSGGTWTLERSLVGTGARSAAGPQQLTSSAGQPAVLTSQGGAYVLRSGFLLPADGAPPPLLSDGFEGTPP